MWICLNVFFFLSTFYLCLKCPAVNQKQIFPFLHKYLSRAVDCLHLQCKQGFSQGWSGGRTHWFFCQNRRWRRNAGCCKSFLVDEKLQLTHCWGKHSSTGLSLLLLKTSTIFPVCHFILRSAHFCSLVLFLSSQAAFRTDLSVLLEQIGAGKESLSFMKRRIRRLAPQWVTAANRLGIRLEERWRDQKKVRHRVLRVRRGNTLKMLLWLTVKSDSDVLFFPKWKGHWSQYFHSSVVYCFICPSPTKLLNLLGWCSIRVLVVRGLVQVNSKTEMEWWMK